MVKYGHLKSVISVTDLKVYRFGAMRRESRRDRLWISQMGYEKRAPLLGLHV